MREQEHKNEPTERRQSLLGEALESGNRPRSSRSRLRVPPVGTGAPSHEQPPAAPSRFDTSSAAELDARLRALSTQATLSHAEFLEATARFDEIGGWRVTGAGSCVKWMMAELGLCRSTAYLELKAARELRYLPTIAGLYASGKLNWCKVKALLRVVTPDDERALAITALGLDADSVQRLCDEYRFGKDTGSDAERDRAQRERRSLTYERCADGSIAMRIVLPPEAGADVVRCLEHHEELLFSNASDGTSARPRPSAPQRRADALVAMAHASLGGAGDVAQGAATASRHLVVTHVDVETLMAAERQVADEPVDSDAPLPSPLRAAIAGVLGGSISPATARRLACEGSLVTMIVSNGEPIAVGRKHRLHTSAQRRAILARDGGCTFPGCGNTRFLDVHHTTMWRDGGETSVSQGVTLCSACHKRVHDEGWRITRVPDDAPIERHPDAQVLIDGADERTMNIVHRMDQRRPAFRFERADAPTAATASTATSCCAEAHASYRVSPVPSRMSMH